MYNGGRKGKEKKTKNKNKNPMPDKNLNLIQHCNNIEILHCPELRKQKMHHKNIQDTLVFSYTHT
jgi:hypothetical protein